MQVQISRNRKVSRMRLSSGLTFLSARLFGPCGVLPLSVGSTGQRKAKRKALLPIAGKVTPAHVTESESGAAVDVSKEIVASKKKNSPLRVDDLGGQPCVLTGEVLTSQSEIAPNDPLRPLGQIEEVRSGFGAWLRQRGGPAGGTQQIRPAALQGRHRETKQWLPFSLMHIGKSLRSSVADKAVECQVAAADVLGLSIVLRGDARAQSEGRPVGG